MKIGLHEEMTSVENQTLEPMTATSTENTPDLHWMELALDDPLFSIIYIRVAGIHLYSVDIIPKPPTKKGPRNLDFEVVYPLYTALTDIIEAGKTPKTRWIKLEAESKEYVWVDYTEEFPVDQWDYSRMDSVMEGLADQLTRKQDLNRGLLIQLTFIE